MSDTTSLYIHIPFCQRRCNYCDFASSLYNQEIADNYLDSLEIEMKDRCTGLKPKTLYIGGGTPTSLDPKQLDRLFRMIYRYVNYERLCEYTIEANPGTVNMEKMLLLRDAGLTRVSLGVQTFNAKGLEILGRIHDARLARTSVGRLQEAGFEDISLDFIYSWPGETEKIWRSDLERALELQIPHISCYCLSYEPGTRLSRQVEINALEALTEDSERRLFDITGEILEKAGLFRYEISNFAVPDFESKHNITYWNGGDYTGLGVGAHSFENGIRHANCNDIKTYMIMIRTGGTARTFEEKLDVSHSARECAVMWLRMRRGIDAGKFKARTGFSLRKLFKKELPNLIDDGWLEWKASHLRLTDKALPLADCVMSELIIE